MVILQRRKQIERILEINNLESVTTVIVEAERDSLVLGIK